MRLQCSGFRSLYFKVIIGSGAAAVVVSKRENEFDTERATRILDGEIMKDEPLLSETEIADAKIDGKSPIDKDF